MHVGLRSIPFSAARVALMRGGAIRYARMIAGLALIFTAVLRLVSRDAVKSAPGSRDDPAV